MKNRVYPHRSGRWLRVLAAFAVLQVCAPPSVHPLGDAQARAKQSARAAQLNDPDEVFVALREAARRNDAATALELASRLDGYDIPSYVEYFRIKPRIFDSGGAARVDAPDAEIVAFLKRYQGQAIADRMRNDWLLVLGKRRDWARFDAEYPQFALDDDSQVRCYALMSRAARSAQGAAQLADEARAQLFEWRNYGEACTDMVAAFAQNGSFKRDDVILLARWALEAGANGPAQRVMALLPDERDDTLANIIRAARNDATAAASLFNAAAERLPRADRAAAAGVVGQFLAKKLDPSAIDFYRRQQELGNESALSAESREWKVRAALRAGDWTLVRQTIEAMPESLRAREPAWTYWLGRALKAAGRDGEARARFAAIAGQHHFYGQLASEELGQRLAVPPRVAVDNAEVDAMRGRPGFERARKFYALNLRFEGNREWNWELRGMSDRELLAAAEYARRIDLLDRAVNSADRTKDQHDFSLRFLMPFREQMASVTQRIGLDMAWAYGLIRQESRFIMNARSNVGAAGLMQVMPSTGRWVARKIGLTDFEPSQLSERDTNLLIGSSYLNMVLNDLDGSWTLASAAYNAGPGRPKAWRATLTRPVEGAIFAETIPFPETRGYVKNVLSNAVWYGTLISGQPQSLKARLGTIAPRSVVVSDLP